MSKTMRQEIKKEQKANKLEVVKVSVKKGTNQKTV